MVAPVHRTAYDNISIDEKMVMTRIINQLTISQINKVPRNRMKFHIHRVNVRIVNSIYTPESLVSVWFCLSNKKHWKWLGVYLKMNWKQSESAFWTIRMNPMHIYYEYHIAIVLEIFSNIIFRIRKPWLKNTCWL